ncbi:REP-associated tyrosine transposase [Neisseria subflava]|uniref:REP-associated tyrosine transposase n=1 Tax=Neisseria subflava TaxID=28449 RepID=UPI0024B09CAD|nr:transposase [Neisseria subflava]
MSSENVSFNKVKTLNNKLFLLQHPNHKQKSYGALSQKLHWLPPDDADYSLRWRLIKTKFSTHFPHAENLSASKQRRNERGIWQRRFYEHTVRDETDLQRCADYIHFNPVKHGLCDNARDWAFSSFHRYVRDGWLPLDWGGIKETAVMSFGE